MDQQERNLPGHSPCTVTLDCPWSVAVESNRGLERHHCCFVVSCMLSSVICGQPGKNRSEVGRETCRESKKPPGNPEAEGASAWCVRGMLRC